MTILKQSIRNMHRYEMDSVVKRAGCESAKDVLDFLFGTHNNNYDTDFVIKYDYAPKPKGTVCNRLNTLWVYPLFLLAVIPRYIMFGDVRVSEDSNFGKLLIRLIGELW